MVGNPFKGDALAPPATPGTTNNDELVGQILGGFVQGQDFIMPAIRPIFDKIAEEAWREVTKI